MHRLSNQVVDEVRLRKAHFGLMGVDIDINILRRKGQEHKHHRMALLRQNVTVGFREGMQENPISDEATVDKQILPVACGAAPRRW